MPPWYILPRIHTYIDSEPTGSGAGSAAPERRPATQISLGTGTVSSTHPWVRSTLCGHRGGLSNVLPAAHCLITRMVTGPASGWLANEQTVQPSKTLLWTRVRQDTSSHPPASSLRPSISTHSLAHLGPHAPTQRLRNKKQASAVPVPSEGQYGLHTYKHEHRRPGADTHTCLHHPRLITLTDKRGACGPHERDLRKRSAAWSYLDVRKPQRFVRGIVGRWFDFLVCFGPRELRIACGF
jgi:hypothetical protein